MSHCPFTFAGLSRRPSPGLKGLVLQIALLAVLAGTALKANEADSPPPAGVGSTVEVVTVKGISYLHAKVVTISRQSVTIRHAAGIASIPWEDLPEGWRKALASQIPPDMATPTKAPKKKAPPTPVPTASAKALATPADAGVGLAALVSGPPVIPEIRQSVDFRERLSSLRLWIKNQGHRPSCSVYAIISALEFQYSVKLGRPVHFSEEHLLNATKSVAAKAAPVKESEDPNAVSDTGYTLPEVIRAIELHGLEVLRDPPQGIIEDATENIGPKSTFQPKVTFRALPKEAPEITAGRLITLLNLNVPVPIGLDWPAGRAADAGFLNQQSTADGIRHAVTLVGYQNTTGILEDTVFLFRNSYGPTWGATGYGRVTYSYLAAHLQGAVVVVIR